MVKMHWLSTLFQSILLLVLSLLLFYLSSLSSFAAAIPNTSYVRVIHASPFVGTADVFVDGKLLLTSFQFASITDYVPLPAGTHKVQISLVGKGIDASALTQDLTVQPGDVDTVAALGTQPNALSLQVFADNNLVTPNLAKVRIYHLAPDAGPVNVDVGGDALLKNVSYDQASTYLNEDVGPCDINFTDPQYNQDLALTASLHANTVTSVFAVGLFQGDPKIQLVQAQTTGIPGAPNTGSDPHPVSSPITLPLFWLFLPLAALLFTGSYYRVRQARKHR